MRKRVQMLEGGVYFYIFPGKCKILKITVLNCYSAENCKNRPQSHFGTYPCTAPGGQTLNPIKFYRIQRKKCWEDEVLRGFGWSGREGECVRVNDQAAS